MSVKKFTVIFLAVVLFAIPLFGCSGMFSDSPDIAPHLIAEPDENPVRPIDAREGAAMSEFSLPLSDEQYRARVDELYQIVAEDGCKPIFADDDPVKPLYDTAISLLNRYIKNAWHTEEGGQINTVHSIHDYLITTVDYDNDLYESYQKGADVTDNPAFHIDGVLMKKLAVCDGLSKAFVFLCAIEGIDAVRVTGTYISVPHAWNKVKVDGAWYNIDVTADAAYYLIDGNTRVRQLSHGFFLLSDHKLKTFRPKLHVFESTVPCDVDYDYYADKIVKIGDKTFQSVVTSQAELNSIFEAIGKSDKSVGKIELKLNFAGKVNVNDSDVYTSEINTAYTRIMNADFTTASQRPYFQSPDGVYLFLIYK